MNSIHRIGVTIAGLATVGTVAAAFVVQGYVTADQTAHQPVAQASSTATPGATATLGPEIVYVNPIPSPAVVHITQTQPPVAAPPVIHVVVPTVGGDDSQGSDD